MSELLDYSGLYQLLADLVARKRTQTLLGKTDNNRALMVGILRGEIVSLVCAGKRGRSAIPAVRQIAALTFRLDDNAAPTGGMDLPPTTELMDALRPSTGDPDHPSPPRATDGVAPDQGRDGPRLCELLSRFIGPIAPVLCAETIKAAGGLGSDEQKQSVILALAKEIDNDAEAEQFIESARKILGAI
jgi:hypothetical protein